MKKAIIIDVDLTLVTDTPYDMAQATSAEYNAGWHRQTLEAKPLELGVQLVEFFHGLGFALVVMTARDEPGRPELNVKLRELGIHHMFTEILMRDSVDNGKPSAFVKGKMIDACRDRYKFVFAMDDANHDLYRERGIKVIDANNWNGR
jgi:phosphoglycolate phosphatase-like HAD superfamily hydrolase